MTREEAIKALSDMDSARRNYSHEEYVALEMAINALSAIEDIKAEINEFIKNPQFGDLDMGASCGAVKCLEIIDKHIGGEKSND